jgi:adenine-specific DNA methylase
LQVCKSPTPGTPLLEANRVGCNVIGLDINPMSFWIVKQEIEHLNIDEYIHSAYSVRKFLAREIGYLYKTHCIFCGADDADVKYFIWVKVIKCHNCQEDIDLFPGYLIAGNTRHPKNVFVCPACGQLTEVDNREFPGACRHCRKNLSQNGPAKRNHCVCPKCSASNSYPDATLGPPRHRLIAIEFFCSSCRVNHVGRYFKSPDENDLSRIHEAHQRWAKMCPIYVPDEEIPTGDETNRLHRWGYKRYQEMFNSRQLLGLELSARQISQISNERIHNALATNLSDLLRYQNMLCRYDTMALKSLDIFSVHGFPVGLIQCESNLLGIMDSRKNTCIGSGGWANIIEKFRKAKSYCDTPFEVKYTGSRKEIIPINGEWIGDHLDGEGSDKRRIVDIRCEDASKVQLQPASLDAVFTDPPYFGNVQYAELMDFCYVWLRRLLGGTTTVFEKLSTRNPHELTENEDMGRGLEYFTEGLSSVFQRMAEALKPGAPLTFTYHHNELRAYYPVAVAILDAGLTCSASLPCPAEMNASIHINATGSSIIDTVFVCRSTGVVSRKYIVNSTEGLARVVAEDLEKLRTGNVKPTKGDARCIAFGHLIRLAVWSLRKKWNKNRTITKRISAVARWLQDFGGWVEVEKYMRNSSDGPLFAVREKVKEFGAEQEDVPF